MTGGPALSAGDARAWARAVAERGGVRDRPGKRHCWAERAEERKRSGPRGVTG
jgi:hypothetical protein